MITYKERVYVPTRVSSWNCDGCAFQLSESDCANFRDIESSCMRDRHVWKEQASKTLSEPLKQVKEYQGSQEAVKVPVEPPKPLPEPSTIPNSMGGIKFDNQKVRPTLLVKSMPYALDQVIDVLDKGARKYAPDNWRKVEVERYEDALLRHVFAYFQGEKHDRETGNHHLAHAICCSLFMIELTKGQ